MGEWIFEEGRGLGKKGNLRSTVGVEEVNCANKGSRTKVGHTWCPSLTLAHTGFSLVTLVVLWPEELLTH